MKKQEVQTMARNKEGEKRKMSLENMGLEHYFPLPPLSPDESPTKNVPLKQEVEALQKESNLIKGVVIGIILVSFIGIVGFLIDAFLYRTAAYKDFKQTIDQQGAIINQYQVVEAGVDEGEEDLGSCLQTIEDLEKRVELLEENGAQ